RGRSPAPQGANQRAGAPAKPLAVSIYIALRQLQTPAMIELMRTNDPVVISFVEALLRDAEISFLIADQNMSIIEGSIGVLPRRILVASDEEAAARRLLSDAGIASEMR